MLNTHSSRGFSPEDLLETPDFVPLALDSAEPAFQDSLIEEMTRTDPVVFREYSDGQRFEIASRLWARVLDQIDEVTGPSPTQFAAQLLEPIGFTMQVAEASYLIADTLDDLASNDPDTFGQAARAFRSKLGSQFGKAAGFRLLSESHTEGGVQDFAASVLERSSVDTSWYSSPASSPEDFARLLARVL